MDFDPHSIKWKCCCCSLPNGMRLLASVEFAFCTITATIAMYFVCQQKPEDITAFEVCLISLMLFVALSSILLIIGVQRHSAQLIYPSLLARGLATLFLAVFGVSTVFASTKPENQQLTWKQSPTSTNMHTTTDQPNIAVRLVLFVFAMLFLTVIIFYCSYLVVRLIHYEKAYARLKDRRTSLIQAGMIDPDYPSPHNNYPSRRASSA